MTKLLKRRYNRFKNKPKLPPQFIPVVSIEGPNLWATCIWLSKANQLFTSKQEQAWLPVLARHLREKYGVEAENLTLTWVPERWSYRVNFNNDEEFIMLKMVHM